MSVIVNEMPDNCLECPLSYWDYYFSDLPLRCPLMSDKTEVTKNKRHEDCPLKSVGGLIEEIEGSIEELRKYNEQLHYRSNFHGTPEIHSISGQIAGLLKTVEIIKTYCGMEDAE